MVVATSRIRMYPPTHGRATALRVVLQGLLYVFVKTTNALKVVHTANNQSFICTISKYLVGNDSFPHILSHAGCS